MRLRELFDRSLPLEWDSSSAPEYLVARAYDRQGALIEISFTINVDLGMADVEFSRGGSLDTTGQGDENIVFATVVTAFNEFMKNYGDNIRTIYYGGAEDRQGLYSRLARRLGQAYGFTRAAKPAGSIFKMVRTKV